MNAAIPETRLQALQAPMVEILAGEEASLRKRHIDGLTAAGIAASIILFIGALAAGRWFSLQESRFPTPPVADLHASGGSLAWTNPAAYDRIIILRDGEEIARVPGTSRTHADAKPSETFTVYTIIGELQGIRSPAMSCLNDGMIAIRPVAGVSRWAFRAAILAAFGGAAFAIWGIASAGARRHRRIVLPGLARALEPLHPGEAELEAVIARLKEGKQPGAHRLDGSSAGRIADAMRRI